MQLFRSFQNGSCITPYSGRPGEPGKPNTKSEVPGWALSLTWSVGKFHAERTRQSVGAMAKDGKANPEISIPV
jgi:hypothetical protein